MNNITGSLFGNQVLRAYAQGQIPLPLVMVEVSEDGYMCVKDTEGRYQPELQSMYVQSLQKGEDSPCVIRL